MSSANSWASCPSNFDVCECAYKRMNAGCPRFFGGLSSKHDLETTILPRRGGLLLSPPPG
eukprot:CAMPEP_0198552098 /NCGR_PEP_ID=MMETSP1462-20131121/78005_1 /TAXON_ID=1333877 /ORGANISM="Brandtodinium nutriculum, Strain RCC3387" /LENGTH=59 /DNA_ID=CAMNT_0044282749 /DNA_START=116 /DNA_END=292 /DNA_ORIENTATION=-